MNKENEIRKKLLLCLVPSEAFSYLGHLWLTHKKITSQEFQEYFKWWRANHNKRVLPPKDEGGIKLTEDQIARMPKVDPTPLSPVDLVKEGINILGTDEEKAKLKQQEDEDYQRRIQEIPF